MSATPEMSSSLSLVGTGADRAEPTVDSYRRETNWLKQVNDLHSRMAGARDLTTMVEEFASWLEPIVAHDLVGVLDRGRSRAHLSSSLHGPDRRVAIAITHEIMARGRRLARPVKFVAGGLHVALWRLDVGDCGNHLVIIRSSGTITDDESRIVEQARLILEPPLHRALDYEEIYEQARRDPLTGLANRRVLDEQIDSLLEGAARHRRPMMLAALDLDRFKLLNDNLGHAAGDQALRDIARAISQLIRGSDLLVRVGGDEFLLVLPDTSAGQARALAERVCRAVGGMRIDTGAGVCVGVSIGLAEWRRDYSRDEWLQQADEALYQAKKQGRHRVCLSAMR